MQKMRADRLRKDSEGLAISTESSTSGTRIRIARNAGVVLIARGITNLVRLLIISLLASYLGKEGFGIYSYIVAFGEIFGVLSDFGVIRVGVREIARNKNSAAEQFGNVLALKGLLSLGTIGTVLAVAWAGRMETSLRSGIIIYTLAVVVNYYANSFFVFYRAFEHMEYESVLIILERSLYLFFAFLAVRRDLGLNAIFLANLISSTIKLVAAPIITHFKLVKLSFHIEVNSFLLYLQESLPIGISMFLASLYLRVDVLILEYLRGSAEVGAFSGAYRIIDATMILPVVIVSALFPVLSRRFESSDEAFRRFLSKSFRCLLLLALPIAVGISVWAEFLVSWILDKSFVESVYSLRLLTLVLVLSYPNFLFSYTMTTLGKQKAYTIAVGLGLVLNILIAFLLVPSMGYVGACLATVLAEIFVFVLAIYFLKRYANYSLALAEIWKPLAAAMLMGGIAYLGNSWNPVLRFVFVLPLAGIVYVAGLILLGAVSSEEILNLQITLSHFLRLRFR